MTDPATASEAARKHRQLLVLLCVSIPSFMINLDANIVAVSLPSIAHALKADFAAIEWVISAYTLTFASLVLPAGMLADRYGRKFVLVAGLALFTVASLMCGAAPNVSLLIVGRALQGVGAALLLSAALAILSQEFRGPDRARAFAFWGSVIGVGITVGPIVGGIITQGFGWEWAFYVNIPVGAGIIALTLYAVTDSRNPRATSVDIPGFVSFASALFLLTLALISGNHAGWANPSVRAEFVASAVLFSLFLVVETRVAHPMLDLSFFRRPTYIGANIAGVAYASALLTMLTFLPLYFQGGLGFSPINSGLMMLPMAVPLVVVPRVTARYLTHRLSGQALLTAGLLLVCIGDLAMGAVAGGLRYVPMLAGMLIAGTGAGILNGETAKISMTVIPPERAGMAAGVGGTLRFTGIVVGFAALGAIFFQSVLASLRDALPDLPGIDRFSLAQRIVSGGLPGVIDLIPEERAASLTSFGSGYATIFFTAAAIALFAAVTSWLLISPSDTRPMPRTTAPDRLAPAPID